MPDPIISTGAPPTGPLPARSTPLPTAATPEPGPTVGTDQLSLSTTPPAATEHQYFDHAPIPGHKNIMTLSVLLKQPLWADDRTKITADQWAAMPEAQQQEILAMIPTDPAKAQFRSSVSPATAKAQAELGDMAKKLWNGAQAWHERYAADHPAPPPAAAAPPPTTDAQVDRLNQLIEQGEPKR